MFYVYILKSLKHGRYYIGYSAHPKERLEQHNLGKVKSTKAYIPYKQVLVEKYSTRSEAMKREKELKKMKSGVKFKELVGGAQG